MGKKKVVLDQFDNSMFGNCIVSLCSRIWLAGYI